MLVGNEISMVDLHKVIDNGMLDIFDNPIDTTRRLEILIKTGNLSFAYSGEKIGIFECLIYLYGESDNKIIVKTSKNTNSRNKLLEYMLGNEVPDQPLRLEITYHKEEYEFILDPESFKTEKNIFSVICGIISAHKTFSIDFIPDGTVFNAYYSDNMFGFKPTECTYADGTNNLHLLDGLNRINNIYFFSSQMRNRSIYLFGISDSNRYIPFFKKEAIQGAVNLISGMWATPRVNVSIKDGNAIVSYLFGKDFSGVRNLNSIYNSDRCVSLFKSTHTFYARSALYCLRKSKINGNYNNLIRLHGEVIHTFNKSLWAMIISACVCVEGLLEIIPQKSENKIEIERKIKSAKYQMRKIKKEIEIYEYIMDSISRYGGIGPKSRLKELSLKNILDGSNIDVWHETRNAIAHGEIIEMGFNDELREKIIRITSINRDLITHIIDKNYG